MRIAAAISASLHLGVILVTMIAWPSIRPAPPTEEPPAIPIELVTLAEETNIMAERKAPPKPEPVEPPKPDPEELELPKPTRTVEPPPAPEPEPMPEPEPEPIPPENPKPEPVKPEPEETPAPPERFAKVRPRVKPALQDRPEPRKPPKEEDFFSKSAKVLLDKRPEEQEERKFHEDAEAVLTGTSDREGVGRQDGMTVSLLDALRAQISRCWSPPVGALDADKLIIEMVIEFNQDGTVRRGINNPQIKDQFRYNSDRYFRAAADAARRAVLACEGEGYKLPPNTPVIQFMFDPSKMVGVR